MSSSVSSGHALEKVPRIVTAGGLARSGKGTSMENLRQSLENLGRTVELIDQGIKFRVMGAVAIDAKQPLDSPASLDNFLSSGKAQEATLKLLKEVAQMDNTERKARLYTPYISRAAGRVGKVSSSHHTSVGLLRDQVKVAADAGVDVVIIDGRSIEKYAYEFADEGLARFAIGWYFKCDPAIAARRSLGLFGDVDDMDTATKLELLQETFNISDRNQSDMLRGVDPLREPINAHHLDLLAYDSPDRIYTPYKISHDITYRSAGGMAVVDTSYTHSIEEMTNPVTELSRFALMWQGAISHQDVGIKTIDADEYSRR
jgi:cytidylate kinase